MAEEATAEGVGGESWIDGLGEEYQGNESLARYKNLDDFAKGHLELEKKLGTAIQPVAEDATDEDKAKFNSKVAKLLGCPEKPEEYDIPKPKDLPEGVEYAKELEDGIRAKAHELGVPKATLTALANIWNGFWIAQAAKEQAAVDKTFTDGEATLKAKWGGDYEKNVEIANRAYTAFGGEEFVKLVFEKTKIGNHPLVHELFYNIGVKMLPEKVVPGTETKVTERQPGVLHYKSETK